MRINMSTVSRLLGLILIGAALSGCRTSAQPTPTATVGLKITLEAASLKTGPTTLMITVLDAEGKPINDAQIEARGDMSHAGMAPSLGRVEKGIEGRYSMAFQWTMGGDWVVTVTVTLTDGRSTSQQFPFTIQSQ